MTDTLSAAQETRVNDLIDAALQEYDAEIIKTVLAEIASMRRMIEQAQSDVRAMMLREDVATTGH